MAKFLFNTKLQTKSAPLEMQRLYICSFFLFIFNQALINNIKHRKVQKILVPGLNFAANLANILWSIYISVPPIPE